jgi:hypothetical protein
VVWFPVRTVFTIIIINGNPFVFTEGSKGI